MERRPSKLRHETMGSSSMLEGILRRDRQVVAIALLSVVTICWLYLLAGAGTGIYPHEMAVLNPSTRGTGPPLPSDVGISGHNMAMQPLAWTSGYALLMFSMWWLMMIAMMLPSAAPVVLLHAAITRRGHAQPEDVAPSAPSQRLLSATTAFLAGYLVMWGVFSLVAVVAQWVLERGGLLTAMMTLTSRLMGSGLLLAAGLWQLTPLKTVCLRHCRSPISFLSTHWRPGVCGAFRMGTEHGVFCLGCCWVLMTLLFFGGVMNLIWIIGLALFIFAEKILPAGVIFGRLAALLLIGWGVWLGFTAF